MAKHLINKQYYTSNLLQSSNLLQVVFKFLFSMKHTVKFIKIKFNFKKKNFYLGRVQEYRGNDAV